MSEPTKGTYALVLHLESSEEITVGKLGTFTFPAGFYLYVGSALGPGAWRIAWPATAAATRSSAGT